MASFPSDPVRLWGKRCSGAGATALALAVTLFVCCLLSPPAVAQRWEESQRDELLGLIAQQVTNTNQGVSNEALAALRRLRDPRLRPVFVRLSSSANPDRVVSALLGMADLETPPRVDVVRMAELPNENARAGAVGLTLRMGYLDADGLERVCTWPRLGDTLETLLIAELMGQDRQPPAARLAELSRSSELMASTLARLLEGGLSEESQRELAGRFVDGVLERERTVDRALEPVLLALRRAGARSSAAFVLRLNDLLGDELRPERETLQTLAVVDPASAARRWTRAFDSAGTTARRFSLGLAALLSDGAMGDSVHTALIESGDATLAAMGTAARAMSRPHDEQTVRALVELLDTKYDQATAWTIEQGRSLEPGLRIRFARELVRWSARTGEASVRSALLAYEGARLLADDDPAALRTELDRMVGGDETVLRAALRGIIEASRRGRVWSAGDEPRWPTRQVSGLASICAGLFDLGEGIGPGGGLPAGSPDFEALTLRLIEAATGGSGLPDPARVQAAWLALVRRDPGAEVATRLLHLFSR